jgi:hypothetical protein
MGAEAAEALVEVVAGGSDQAGVAEGSQIFRGVEAEGTGVAEGAGGF